MRKVHNYKTLISKRKDLRNSATPQEIILWSRLKGKQLGYKFRRQESLGSYIVDFYCPEKKLIIELDGWQHGEENEIQYAYDKERTKFLEGLGYTVLRFWNGEVNTNLTGVIDEINKYLR